MSTEKHFHSKFANNFEAGSENKQSNSIRSSVRRVDKNADFRKQLKINSNTLFPAPKASLGRRLRLQKSADLSLNLKLDIEFNVNEQMVGRMRCGAQ